jgi:CubicO group peptidase (beta-lactamase class C family)
MKLTSPTTLAVWLASTLSSAQNCPLHGPAYPAPTDVASPAFVAAKAKWDEVLASNPQVNKTGISFAVEIYSAGKDARTIHRSFNTADHQKGKVDVGPDTLFRVHSISKVITVYTILSKLGFKHWHDPVTKWVPELANEGKDPISDVDWDEVTLGSLASSMSGISRGCTACPRWTTPRFDC